MTSVCHVAATSGRTLLMGRDSALLNAGGASLTSAGGLADRTPGGRATGCRGLSSKMRRLWFCWARARSTGCQASRCAPLGASVPSSGREETSTRAAPRTVVDVGDGDGRRLPTEARQRQPARARRRGRRVRRWRRSGGGGGGGGLRHAIHSGRGRGRDRSGGRHRRRVGRGGVGHGRVHAGGSSGRGWRRHAATLSHKAASSPSSRASERRSAAEMALQSPGVAVPVHFTRSRFRRMQLARPLLLLETAPACPTASEASPNPAAATLPLVHAALPTALVRGAVPLPSDARRDACRACPHRPCPASRPVAVSCPSGVLRRGLV